MGKEENFSNEATYERLLADYDQLQLDYKDQVAISTKQISVRF